MPNRFSYIVLAIVSCGHSELWTYKAVALYLHTGSYFRLLISASATWLELEGDKTSATKTSLTFKHGEFRIGEAITGLTYVTHALDNI